MKLFLRKKRVVRLGRLECRSDGREELSRWQFGRSSFRRWSRDDDKDALEGERKRVKSVDEAFLSRERSRVS